MKKLSILYIFIAISSIAFSQKTGRFYVGLYVPVGKIDYNVGMMSDGGYRVKAGFRMGIDLSYAILKHIHINSGFEYYNTKMEAYSIMPGFTGTIPGSQQILTIPLCLKVDILKYFFITGGYLFDKELQNENAPTINGRGLLLGFGFQYTIKNHLTIMLQPCLQMHGILGSENNFYDPGVKLGIGYKF